MGSDQIVLYSVAGPSGQGHETVFPELIAGLLGIDPHQVTLRAGDPDGPALMGSPAIGSRTILTHGSTYKLAAEQAIEKGRPFAADLLETSVDDVEFSDGRYRVKGTDRTVTFGDVMRRTASETPHPLDTTAEMAIVRAFPSGAHVAEIEIDAETGAVEVVDYTAVDDIGNVINPVLADGQLIGGVVQGAGQAFGEHCLYDRDNGQLVAGSFMDYIMPRADLVPHINSLSQVVPSPGNALGAKGAGEAGTTGAGAACMNAVANALRSLGVEHFDMPTTPARVWAAIADARRRSGWAKARAFRARRAHAASRHSPCSFARGHGAPSFVWHALRLLTAPLPTLRRDNPAPSERSPRATIITAAAWSIPSGNGRPRARIDAPRGSPTPPATGRAACRRPRRFLDWSCDRRSYRP